MSIEVVHILLPGVAHSIFAKEREDVGIRTVGSKARHYREAGNGGTSFIGRGKLKRVRIERVRVKKSVKVKDIIEGLTNVI